jgi:hypothetical protein
MNAQREIKRYRSMTQEGRAMDRRGFKRYGKWRTVPSYRYIKEWLKVAHGMMGKGTQYWP